ncbi:ketopantoate reductase family protein [Cohnella terricola]|uniref:2-dehydropantoate 2-reductase n=1 Tax=Cohnella terricola TaxID=1289167 RepID=A0A559JIG8_9BACL|nr:ketopantoate reductase family protein [Cohnella terricola]TVX99668.1 ketopantoate reductase family protein [Cohnella terricola]
MKILVVGAGAVGGYAAARLLEAGLDVTLLVREGRKRQIAANGLVVLSPSGDYVGHPPLLVAGETGGPFDLAVIASKAYGLPLLLDQLKPYLHSRTAILPLLNGMKHMEQIAEALPGQPLLGGVARIEATLEEDGSIRHLTAMHRYTYGRYRANLTDTEYEIVHQTLSGVSLFSERADIEQDLWEKYAFISVMSGLTTLFQATVGEIRDSEPGLETFRRAFEETERVVRAAGGRLSEGYTNKQMAIVEGMSSASTTSMLRDMTQGLPTESEHIHGYLIELARRHGCPVSLFEVIRQRLAIYETRRSALADRPV